jgi:hypothetical protein
MAEGVRSLIVGYLGCGQVHSLKSCSSSSSGYATSGPSLSIGSLELVLISSSTGINHDLADEISSQLPYDDHAKWDPMDIIMGPASRRGRVDPSAGRTHDYDP